VIKRIDTTTQTTPTSTSPVFDWNNPMSTGFTLNQWPNNPSWGGGGLQSAGQPFRGYSDWVRGNSQAAVGLTQGYVGWVQGMEQVVRQELADHRESRSAVDMSQRPDQGGSIPANAFTYGMTFNPATGRYEQEGSPFQVNTGGVVIPVIDGTYIFVNGPSAGAKAGFSTERQGLSLGGRLFTPGISSQTMHIPLIDRHVVSTLEMDNLGILVYMIKETIFVRQSHMTKIRVIFVNRIHKRMASQVFF